MVPPPVVSSDSQIFNAEDETEATIDGSSSNRFRDLVKEVIQHNQYPSDPIVSSFPELKSNRVENKPSVYRLPRSQYVLQKLEFSRLNLEAISERKSGKVFFKPPSTLERVAEVGDALHYVENKNKTRALRVVREIPPPPVSFNDILARRSSTPNFHSTRVELAPTEAKNIELANIWGLKSTNYLDHFQEFLQSVSAKALAQVEGLCVWSSSDKPVISPDVISTIAGLKADLVTSQACLAESKELLQSAVDTMVYTKGMFELVRRDNLMRNVSYSVNPATTRALRLSAFDGSHCFEKEVCVKAYAEIRDGNKDKSNYSQKRYASQQNQHFDGLSFTEA